MNVKAVFDCIDVTAPFNTAEKWDNPGLLVGCFSDKVTKVLVSLDITPQVVLEAHEKAAELIVSHHPVIFDPLKSLRPGSPPYLLAKYGIAAVCAHTNLDKAFGGVNDILAAAAGIKGKAAPITEEGENAFTGRIGCLESPLSVSEYAAFIKKSLNAEVVRFSDGGRPVSRVAVVGGSGGDFVEMAAEAGADTLLTGDVKYHEFLLAKELSLNLVDAGHFATENPVVDALCKRLSAELPQIEFFVANHGDIVKGL